MWCSRVLAVSGIDESAGTDFYILLLGGRGLACVVQSLYLLCPHLISYVNNNNNNKTGYTPSRSMPTRPVHVPARLQPKQATGRTQMAD